LYTLAAKNEAKMNGGGFCRLKSARLYVLTLAFSLLGDIAANAIFSFREREFSRVITI
jgi:hypothetical protein